MGACVLLMFTKVMSAQSDYHLHLFCACLSCTQPQCEDAWAIVYPKANHIVWYTNLKEVVWGGAEGHFLRKPDWDAFLSNHGPQFQLLGLNGPEDGAENLSQKFLWERQPVPQCQDKGNSIL